jgi:hypothetical protein
MTYREKATMRATSASNTERTMSMAATMPRQPVRAHGRATDSVELRLALAWGCSARIARQRMDECFRDAAQVVAAMMDCGESDRLAKKMAPLDLALTAWKVCPPEKEASVTAQRADSAEDVSEAEYHAHECRETARALVKAGAVERLRSELRDAALINRWEL